MNGHESTGPNAATAMMGAERMPVRQFGMENGMVRMAATRPFVLPDGLTERILNRAQPARLSRIGFFERIGRV
jgi:hypothetical protein